MLHPPLNFKKMNHTHCCYCRRKFAESLIRTEDHFIPKSRGGKFAENKLQCCIECNGWKADKMPERWLGQVEYFEQKKMKNGNYSVMDYRQIIGSLRHFMKKLKGKRISDYKY